MNILLLRNIYFVHKYVCVVYLDSVSWRKCELKKFFLIFLNLEETGEYINYTRLYKKKPRLERLCKCYYAFGKKLHEYYTVKYYSIT